MVRYYLGIVELPMFVVRWVATLVAATSKLVGLLISLYDISDLDAKKGMMSKWVS